MHENSCAEESFCIPGCLGAHTGRVGAPILLMDWGEYLRDAAPATSQQAGRPGGAACSMVFSTCLMMLPTDGLKGRPKVMYTMKMQIWRARAKAYRRKTSCMHSCQCQPSRTPDSSPTCFCGICSCFLAHQLLSMHQHGVTACRSTLLWPYTSIVVSKTICNGTEVKAHASVQRCQFCYFCGP